MKMQYLKMAAVAAGAAVVLSLAGCNGGSNALPDDGASASAGGSTIPTGGNPSGGNDTGGNTGGNTGGDTTGGNTGGSASGGSTPGGSTGGGDTGSTTGGNTGGSTGGPALGSEATNPSMKYDRVEIFDFWARGTTGKGVDASFANTDKTFYITIDGTDAKNPGGFSSFWNIVIRTWKPDVPDTTVAMDVREFISTAEDDVSSANAVKIMDMRCTDDTDGTKGCTVDASDPQHCRFDEPTMTVICPLDTSTTDNPNDGDTYPVMDYFGGHGGIAPGVDYWLVLQACGVTADGQTGNCDKRSVGLHIH